jgi:hypothetical protein
MKVRFGTAAFSLAIGVAIVMPGVGDAAPVQWSGNGHWYEAVATPLSWSAANAAAAASAWMGTTGHLVTISSAAENLFVSALGEVGGFAVGGLQDPGAGTPSAGWQWVTGEPFVYMNWNAGEPNDLNGSEGGGGFSPPQEDFMTLVGITNADGLTWNDITENTNGYIVEYENLAAIPEPETYALLLAGLGLIGFAARRRKMGTVRI